MRAGEQRNHPANEEIDFLIPLQLWSPQKSGIMPEEPLHLADESKQVHRSEGRWGRRKSMKQDR